MRDDMAAAPAASVQTPPASPDFNPASRSPKQPIRVLHVMASRSNGGAETYCADMIARLHGAGVDQMAIVPRGSLAHRRLDACGIALSTAVLDVPWTPWRRYRLSAAITAYQPTVVHCWLRRAASLVPALRVPVIGWFGGYYDPKHFDRCSHFIGVTDGIVTHMRRRGVAAHRAHYVPTFAELDEEPAVERRALDTPPGATVLLSLSRLHEKKGLDVLLDALPALPGCVAWIAGDGPIEANLRALAKRLGVSNRVRFLGWRTDRAALLRAADVCVLPSRYEPFGTVMLEAWAAGIPIVAANSDGPAGLIKHGETGLLVPVDDALALAAAVNSLAGDQALRGRLVNNGRARHRKDFAPEVVVGRMLAAYRHIADLGATLPQQELAS